MATSYNVRNFWESLGKLTYAEMAEAAEVIRDNAAGCLDTDDTCPLYQWMETLAQSAATVIPLIRAEEEAERAERAK